MTSDKLFVEKLNRQIDEHLDNSVFTVDTLCQLLGLSRSQLHRATKEHTGLSVSLYIRQHRLLKARELLLATDLRIAEISDQVGIANAQNFSTYFTEEFGLSPTEFRKQRIPLSPSVVEPLPEPGPLEKTQPDPPPTPDLPSSQTSNAPSARWRGWYYAVMATGLLLLGVGLYGWQQAWFVNPPTDPVRNSLAILPFTNLGGTEGSPACDGIMDDVHTSVSLIKNLKVIARTSSDQYNNTRKSIWQIGDELQVANILKGSALKTKDQLQVRVELINTKDDIRVWTKKYSAAYQDIFQLTEQIVRDVANQLRTTIGAPASDKMALVRTKNPEAYNAFLQGRQLLVSRMNNDALASITLFDRALALDSTFADAYAGKAVAYHLLIGSNKMTTPVLNRLTEENALKAIRLDPSNSTAYGVLGSLYYSTYQWQASEHAFRIALQHNPNDAQV